MILEKNELEITPKLLARGTANVLKITSVNIYFKNNEGHTFWSLCNLTDVPKQEATESTPFKAAYTTNEVVSSGNLIIPSDIIDTWTGDNKVIYDYVAKELDITFI